MRSKSHIEKRQNPKIDMMLSGFPSVPLDYSHPQKVLASLCKQCLPYLLQKHPENKTKSHSVFSVGKCFYKCKGLL